MTPAARRDFAHRLRVPLLAFAALLALLAVNIALAVFVAAPLVWIAQLGIALLMLVVVMLFSMEILHEPPLMRLFAVLGFCWVGILFAMTLVDYLTR